MTRDELKAKFEQCAANPSWKKQGEICRTLADTVGDIPDQLFDEFNATIEHTGAVVFKTAKNGNCRAVLVNPTNLQPFLSAKRFVEHCIVAADPQAAEEKLRARLKPLTRGELRSKLLGCRHHALACKDADPKSDWARRQNYGNDYDAQMFLGFANTLDVVPDALLEKFNAERRKAGGAFWSDICDVLSDIPPGQDRLEVYLEMWLSQIEPPNAVGFLTECIKQIPKDMADDDDDAEADDSDVNNAKENGEDDQRSPVLAKALPSVVPPVPPPRGVVFGKPQRPPEGSAF